MATLIRRKKYCGTRLRDSAPHPTGKRLKESRNPVGTTAIGVSGPQVGAKTGRPATAVLPMFEWPRCLPHLHFFDNLSPLGAAGERGTADEASMRVSVAGTMSLQSPGHHRIIRRRVGR